MKTFFQAVRLFVLMTVLTGVVYPVVITFAAKLFPSQANGSLIYKEGKIIGSQLLAQKFQSESYFWPRPSAADFGTIPSGASNQGPTNAGLKEQISARRGVRDMKFASASGLDPHISPEAAKNQVERIAKARNLDQKALYKLLDRYIEGPQFGLFGEPRVNVLRLNIALDSL